MMEYWVHLCSIWLKNKMVHRVTVKNDPKSLEPNSEVMRF